MTPRNGYQPKPGPRPQPPSGGGAGQPMTPPRTAEQFMVPLASYQAFGKRRFWLGFISGVVALRSIQVVADWIMAAQ